MVCPLYRHFVLEPACQIVTCLRVSGGEHTELGVATRAGDDNAMTREVVFLTRRDGSYSRCIRRMA